MANDGVPAIGRNFEVLQHFSAGQKLQLFHNASSGHINDTDNGLDELLVRGSDRKMVGDEKIFTVTRKVGSHRLALDGNATEFVARSEINDANVVIELVAHIKRAAIGTQNGRAGSMAGGNSGGNVPSRGIHDADFAFGRGTSDVQRRIISREHQPGGRRWQADGIHDFSLRDVIAQDAICCVARDENTFTIFRHGQSRGRKIIRGLDRKRQANGQQQNRETTLHFQLRIIAQLIVNEWRQGRDWNATVM